MTTDTDKLDRLIGYLQHDTDNINLLNDVVVTALDLHDDRARIFIDKLLTATHNDAQARFHLATWHMQHRQWSSATALLQALREEGIDSSPIRFNLGIALAYDQDLQQAYVLLAPLADEAAAYPGLRLLLARVCHGLGHFEEGRLHAHSQLEQTPDSADALAILASLLMDEGDHAEANVLARRALELSPHHYEAAHTLAFGALLVGDIDTAGQLASDLLKSKTDDARTWQISGVIALSEQRYDDGELAFQRAVELMPQLTAAWNALGWSQVALGKLDAAQGAFQKALQVDNTHNESIGGLACVSMLQGDTKKAESLLQNALDIDPETYAGVMCRLLGDVLRNDQAAAMSRFAGMMQRQIKSGTPVRSVAAWLNRASRRTTRRN